MHNILGQLDTVSKLRAYVNGTFHVPNWTTSIFVHQNRVLHDSFNFHQQWLLVIDAVIRFFFIFYFVGNDAPQGFQFSA